MCWPRLLRYQQELAGDARLGHPTCFTNLWALVNEALLHDEVWARAEQRAGVVAKARARSGDEGSSSGQ